jgi:hypothetical protein
MRVRMCMALISAPIGCALLSSQRRPWHQVAPEVAVSAVEVEACPRRPAPVRQDRAGRDRAPSPHRGGTVHAYLRKHHELLGRPGDAERDVL